MANCSNWPLNLTPLCDLVGGTYHGFPGGLYPTSNQMPNGHLALGNQIVDQMTPGPAGRIVFASIGYSLTRLTWDQFVPIMQTHPHLNPKTKFANLAQASQDIDQIADPNDDYWTTYFPANCAAEGVNPFEVQAIWFETGESSPTGTFPAHARKMQADLKQALKVCKHRMPNLKLAFLTSSHFTGYRSAGSVEPYVYEQGFAVKWLIEEQLSRSDATMDCWSNPADPAFPWLAWAGYPWTDGGVQRAWDGLTWDCPADVQSDGLHQNVAGGQKLASVLIADLMSIRPGKSLILAMPTTGSPGSPGTPPPTMIP